MIPVTLLTLICALLVLPWTLINRFIGSPANLLLLILSAWILPPSDGLMTETSLVIQVTASCM